MNIEPLADRVLVRVDEEGERNVAGIIIPDIGNQRPDRGEVIAAGPGLLVDGARVPLDVAAGDRVVFSKYGGTEVTVEGDELLLVREGDLLAKITGEGENAGGYMMLDRDEA